MKIERFDMTREGLAPVSLSLTDLCFGVDGNDIFKGISVAMRPRSVILDEPFSGLDIPTKTQLTRYLGRYGGGVVHISHDPRDLQGYDRVIWLEKGALAAFGPANDVLEAYTTEMQQLGGSDDISDLSD